MEQKKLLLVAISVGIFFVIAIGAAILAIRPIAVPVVSAARPISSGTAYTAAVEQFNSSEPAQPATIAPSELIREGVQGIQSAPENAGANIYSNSQPGITVEPSPRTLITVEPKSAAGVPDASSAGKAASTQTRPAVQPVVSKQPAPKSAVSAQPAAPKPATAKPAAAKPVVQTKTNDNYWVQAGSFTAITRAEGVRETLAEKGITSIIENRDVNGTTYFRVRIGPYTSQNEADYWLSLIKSINGFEDSLVWRSQKL